MIYKHLFSRSRKLFFPTTDCNSEGMTDARNKRITRQLGTEREHVAKATALIREKIIEKS